MVGLSVIIPLAPGEMAWRDLLPDLARLPEGSEILLVTSEGQTALANNLSPALPGKHIRLLTGKSGRAGQMNAGAATAQGAYLWFLHADSHFDDTAWPALQRAINTQSDRLLYFDLMFLGGASRLMVFNAWGVYFRSRFFKAPFGDQGFCIRKDLFHTLGGYREDLAYGEDHVFVWHARQNGVVLQPVGAKIFTSARKYKKHGWIKTTFWHQYLWIKQAWPEWRKLKNSQMQK